MIYTHSIGRALQYFPQHTTLLRDERAVPFLELDIQVRRTAAALRRRGLLSGDRLAFLMANGADYIELVYACSLLGVIAVPINTRYTCSEIDRLLEDARPRGPIRHSRFPAPTVSLEWEHVIDVVPLGEAKWARSEAVFFPALTREYSPEARKALSWRIAIDSFFLLVAIYFVGTYLLAFFGISLSVVQVGGGVIVIATGWTH
jgi:acyl-CoA synthetase (AMP-forming)/AMP-acid ligase II